MIEVKKAPELDLESKKSSNWLIGCVLAFALMFVAFEWTQREQKKVETDQVIEAAFEEEVIPITQQQQELTPPPAAAPAVAEILNIVDNQTQLTEETVQTSEENNQAIVVGTGHGAATGPVSSGPVGPVEEASDDNTVFQVVESMPEFPGGMDACMKWLRDNIKYPSICMENNIQGRVTAQFVVNKDGSIVDIKIVKSVDPYLDKEAERVLGKMPKWQPGKQRGKPVRVKFTLPVIFRLQ